MVYHTSDFGLLTSAIVLIAVGVSASIHWKESKELALNISGFNDWDDEEE
ncbi:MAG: hypothetical protein K6F89_06650 [Prevotella sp.]|nr:hypothetical protein [Prevotella sp.]